ncbi:MAG: serine hydrolase domain-containing protein [Rhodococcus sp. (in: high G+C Gram-positive bacteria)]|uniref:serine hydrolase domain-containing protein n=1 Tax=Rhodococcus sp. TaxID=1831 RepID=UPI002ADB784F|nr:serine hydrolase domain-containing protein [Rhodococcus sp. (in: high G+C Gram-positive bacteria)]MDZ7930620.1 serine hydrolase domain-containing protein [Rhodococcus sp. (in: high G+C Gram-positive bacteria)]
MTGTLRELLTRHIDAGLMPGAVALLGGPEAEPVVIGSSSVGGPPMTLDAIVRIQSMTKIVTTVAALRLVQAGRLALDDDVLRWLPELANCPVLTEPGAALDDTVPRKSPITLRHLLTNTSGFGIQMRDTPLARAMQDNETEAGPAPSPLGADEWLARMAQLPLAFAPGAGWRYHHGFAILGILISRIIGRPLQDHLHDDLIGPLDMPDTGLWVPADQCHRLTAAYRYEDGSLIETEPAAGGPYAGQPAVDVSHGELVSTLTDFHRFLRAIPTIVSTEHLELLTHDQVPDSIKTDDSFYPGFWPQTGWGFGVSVVTGGDHIGRFGWSGGQGTDFFVDPDGTIGILLTQTELGEATFALLSEFQELSP